jgi:predicted acetylornithine/succinylornithine family transaminase
MVRGQGARLWDADGKEYIDFFVGFGAGGVAGHCHGAIVSAVKAQAEKLFCVGNLFTNEPQVGLAKMLSEKGFGGQSFFCHSGAEAVEAALKLARINASPGRYKIISFHHCFHGRTMGALSLTPEKFQKGFEPMLPGNVMVDYNDLAAVTAAVDDETAGVILEPIQGEGGLNVPSVEFVRGVRKLCDEKKIAMICDEVWCSPGRTGKWFAYQYFDIEPDILTVAKALGGGMPIAACIAKPSFAAKFVPGTHGCTLGGNPLCAAAGLATMQLIEKEGLLERANRIGDQIKQAIRSAKLPVVKEVRGKGLMLGIEMNKPGKDVFNACLAKGLYINCTQDVVLRLAPAMVVSDEELAKGMEILLGVLARA